MNDATTTKPDTPAAPQADARRRWKMGLGAAVLLVVLAALGLFLWRQRGASDPNAAFSLSGNVDVHQVELAFRVSGRIATMKMQEGDRVSTSQVLAELDPVPFQTDVDSAQADLAQAAAQLQKTQRGFRVEEIAQARANVAQRTADLENARVTLQRQQQLVAAGLATHQQIDDAQARVDMTNAALASARDQLTLELRGSRIEDIQTQEALRDAAQARLEKAQTALADTRLLAPSTGIISVRAREPGAIVQAGQTVYTLTLNDPVWIRAYVAQPRLGRIKPGMQVSVTTDSTRGKQYPGTVGFISPDAEFTPKTVQTEQVRDDLVYRIRVIASDPDDIFR
ncbi:MAG: efflux RND transporter periplasmic adaptor subunit, partial [Gammaproteobacteria bacterium]|nr:efflux RND transporter periplasmic adaptor subunit [Gammaproteobacteria bacterium]